MCVAKYLLDNSDRRSFSYFPCLPYKCPGGRENPPRRGRNVTRSYVRQLQYGQFLQQQTQSADLLKTISKLQFKLEKELLGTELTKSSPGPQARAASHYMTISYCSALNISQLFGHSTSHKLVKSYPMIEWGKATPWGKAP